MTPMPILQAETIIATALYQAIHPLHAATYWKQAPEGALLPLIIYQPQSDIQAAPVVGGIDATCLVTVKAMTTAAATARTLLDTVAPALDTLTYAGYTITATYVRSPQLTPSGGVWQSAHTYRLHISPI